MQYREIEPTPALRPYVRCFWRLLSDDACGQVERIVPDGCPEIVINRAEPFVRYTESGASHAQADVLLVGPLDRPLELAPTGSVDLLGIRFEPGGLFALLEVPTHELTNEDTCLGQISSRLRQRLHEASRLANGEDTCAVLEGVLLDELAPRRNRSGLVRAAVRQLESGARSSAALAGALGVNRRALERLFRLEVGLSPKLMIRIRRVQAVLAGLDSGTRFHGWAAVAAGHGFADQSHLIREFRLLVGTPPQRYLAERTEFAAHFELTDLSRSSNP